MTDIDSVLARQFRVHFKGRKDVYGTDDGGCVRSAPDWSKHLSGERPMGIYPLLDDGTCQFGALDIDRDVQSDAQKFAAGMEALGFKSFVARSRRKGWHVYTSFTDPVQAWKLRSIMRIVMQKCGLPPTDEVFPKQDRIDEGQVGNYIRIPYAGPTDSAGHRAVWEGPDVLTFEQFASIDHRNEPRVLEDAVAMFDLRVPTPYKRPESAQRVQKFDSVLPCAQSMLVNGLPPRGGRQTACFHLIKHLRPCGVTRDEIETILLDLNERSEDPLPISEIHSAMGEYERGHTSYGCEDPAWTEPFCSNPEQCRVTISNRKKEVAAGAPITPSAVTRYAEHDGCTYHVSDSGKTALIGNFTARLKLSVEREAQEKEFIIDGRVQSRDFTLRIPASRMSDERALRASLRQEAGPALVIQPKMSVHLDAAITTLSNLDGPIPVLNSYKRTGWRDLDPGAGKFLIPGRSLSGVEVELERQPYSLHPDADLSEATVALKALIDALDHSITLPVLLFALAGPLALPAGWRNERFCLMLTGLTGSLKTSFAQMVMCMYGPGFADDHRLQRWGEGATFNSLMATSTTSHDLPMLIDNYKPNVGEGPTKFISLVHTIVEGSEKDRLNRNAEMRPGKPIHTWPLITGEDVPSTDSAALARMLVIQVQWERGKPNKNLTIAQKRARHLNALGASWIEWIETPQALDTIQAVAEMKDELRAQYSAELLGLRSDIANPARLATHLAVLDMCWRIAFQHPVVGPILAPLEIDFRSGLDAITALSAESGAESMEAHRFLSAIQQAVASGRAVITQINDHSERYSNALHIGWYARGEGVYLLPDIAIKAAVDVLGPRGLNDLASRTLYTQLDRIGMIATHDAGRATKLVKIDGKVHRVLHITQEAFGGGDTEDDNEEQQYTFTEDGRKARIL